MGNKLINFLNIF